MSKLETGFTPLPNANTSRLRFDLVLPSGVDKAKIVVDTRLTQIMLRRAGIKHFRVITESDDITSSTEVNVVGYTGQGAAYGAGAKTNYVPTSSSESHDSQKGSTISHFADWINVTTRINTDEIAARISNNKKWTDGIRSTKAWAEYLNSDIKNSITREGNRHLLLGLSKSQLLFTLFLDTPLADLISNPSRLLSNPSLLMDPSFLIHQLLLGNVVGAFVGQFINRLSDNDTRFSMVSGPELDNAIVLNLLARTKTLVKNVE